MESIKKTPLPVQASGTSRPTLWPAILAAFALPVFTWYIWYPLAGYGEWTVRIAVILNLAGGAALLLAYRLNRRSVGLNQSRIWPAILRIGLAYGLILILGFAANRLFDAELPLLRSTYRLDGFLEGWILTGLGEELLFSGVLFTLTAGKLSSRKRWLAVLLVALLFALWHLPGYLAQGRSGMDLFGRMAINFASWAFFGTIYALSGNLWMAAFTHGSTDYALTPMIVDNPLIGLLFMGLLVVLSWISSSGRFTNWLRGFNKKIFNRFTLTFAGKHVYSVIHHTGRRSGRRYTTPVAAVAAGDSFIIPLPYGTEVDWCRNILAAGSCELEWRSKKYTVAQPVLLEPKDAVPAFPRWLHPLLRHTKDYLKVTRTL